eukprot:12313096-Alexandrium_andersonii.AAC.1
MVPRVRERTRQGRPPPPARGRAQGGARLPRHPDRLRLPWLPGLARYSEGAGGGRHQHGVQDGPGGGPQGQQPGGCRGAPLLPLR